MTFFRQWFLHPQQLWVRRLNFQVHLWAGIILAAYVVVIGVTGSILVFGLELHNILDQNPFPGLIAKAPSANISQVIDHLQTSYPHTHVVSVMAPTAAVPVFVATLQSRKRVMVACDARTGEVIRELQRRPSRLDWVYDLHENLLARHSGRVVNGCAAACLLLLSVTGMVNWWPGIRRWRGALRVDFRRRWRRINFDVHSAAGFWSFGFLVLWSSSGIYFTWPDKVQSLVQHFSALQNSRPPIVTVDPEPSITSLDFDAMLRKAQAVDPGGQWKGLIFPTSRRSPFEVLVSRAPGVGRDYEDTLYFNPYNGQYLNIWQYGVNKSLGDWIVWLQIPLHFGTHWGLAVKCVWTLFGLTLPLLAVTGLLMYWNRFLRKRWPSL